METVAATTKAENLRAVLRGEAPHWVPFSLNFWQWFNHHHALGDLPEEIAGGDYVDAQIAFGCDIFTRCLDAGFVCTDAEVEAVVENEEEAIGLKTTTTYNTPHGSLVQIDQEQRAQSTTHREEYLGEEWEDTFDALMWLEGQKQYSWDEAQYLKEADRIGYNGLINIPVGCTPLKKMHWDFGLEGTCYLAMEEPEMADEYCQLYWSKLLPVLRRIAEHPRTESVILMDNVDLPFYPPSLCEAYWSPYVREAVELFELKGKTVWVHACGQLKGLSDQFRQTGVHGLEGIAHAPLGDWNVEEAQACHDRFIFNGGYSVHEQRLETRDELYAYMEGFFQRAKRERLMISSSCNVAINTPWERLVWLRDIVRELGGATA